MPSSSSAPPSTTRDRIAAAALPLFAERGYRGTAVGEIERAAGLSPRSGALYKHFPSKRALFEAALADRIAAIDALDARVELMPLADLRSELTMVARLGLAELDRERDLARLVMKEGDGFPELADAFREAIVRRGHRLVADWLQRHATRTGARVEDPDAVAELLTTALVGRVLQEVMFGEALGGVARERFIGAWVRAAAALVGEPERSPIHA